LRLLVPSVAAVIRDREGRLLLQQKGDSEGRSLPAGAIDPGEPPEEALRREVLEETGLVVTEAVLLAALGGKDFRHTYSNGDQVEYTVLVYQCHVDGEPCSPEDAETVALEDLGRAAMPPLALPHPLTLLFD
jgi:8-oxo-dGTP pyrophosphatase MutT (NUDIX family)